MIETTPAVPRRRRKLALSLRGLMALILVVGGVLGWQARRASLQRRSVAAIERLGGAVGYDWQVGDMMLPSFVVPTSPPGPAWLRRIVGDEYFQRVTMVILPDPQRMPDPSSPGDGLMEYERILKAIADDGLACLDGLDADRIDSLQLMNLPPGPGSLDRLARCRGLKSLWVLGDVGPETLARLGEFPGLEDLTISAPLATGANLAFVDRLPGLRDLAIAGAKLTDADLGRLCRLRHLESLRAEGPDVTDAGLALLERLPDLKTVALAGTPVSEEGLAALLKIPKLTRLSIPTDLICQPELDAIKAARPTLTIQKKGPSPVPASPDAP